MAYTYDIILDGAAGRFVIDGDRLEVAGTLVPPGVYSVTLRATQPDGWTAKPFEIEVLADPKRKRFSKSSAGVYSGDVLIRTLWSEQPFEGMIDGRLWDGLDDDGKIAVSGNYTIKVLDASPTRHEWAGAVGNTSLPPGPWWHPNDIMFGMAITNTGKIYCAVGYFEGRTGTLKTTVANPQAWDYVLPVVFRRTGPVARHVTTDNVKAYFAGDDIGSRVQGLWNNTSFVWAVTVADDAAHRFSSGVGVTKAGVTYSGASVLLSTDGTFPGPYYGSGLITGLAVQISGKFLFVSRAGLNNVYVVDKNTGAAVATISTLIAPGAICCDTAGALWIASKNAVGNHIVAKYTVSSDTGALTLVRGSTLTGFSQPLAMSVTPDGATLRVADAGASQQIKSYSNSKFVLESTYGQAGGYTKNPYAANDKFCFFNDCWITHQRTALGVGGAAMTYLAHQPDGKLWVGDSANARNMRFSVSGSAYTYVDQLAWITLSYSSSMDPNNPTRVFSNWQEYAVDYSKSRDDPGWWRLVANWRTGVPAANNDYNTRMRHVTTLSNGRTYTMLRDYVTGLRFFELTSTGMRDTGITNNGLNTVAFMPNGDLHIRAIPSTGSPIIHRRRLLAGFDKSSNPQWAPVTTLSTSPKTLESDPKPQSTFGFGVRWGITPGGVIPAYDTRREHTGWHLGGVSVKNGRWLWRALPSTPTHRFDYANTVTTPRMSEVDWPVGYFDIACRTANIATDCYSVGANIFAHFRGEGWGIAQVNKWWHYHESGLLVSNFGVVQIGEGEAQIGLAGNATAAVVARSGRDLIIIHNDESHAGGVHLWKATGIDDVVIYEEVVTWKSADYRPSVDDPHNLLAGLPYDSSVRNNTAGWTRSPAADVITSAPPARTAPLWAVQTNHWVYDRTAGHVNKPLNYRAPDLHMQAAYRTGDAPFVERTLPADLGAQWVLNAEVVLVQGDIGPVAAPHEYTYIEIVDHAGLVIARFNINENSSVSRWNVYGNGVLIANLGSNDALWDLMMKAQPLVIGANAKGAVTFRYGDLPEIITAPLNPLANWKVPAKFRVQFKFGTAGATSRSVNLRKLRID